MQTSRWQAGPGHAGHFPFSPSVQTTSEDKHLMGALMPTKHRQDFCCPGLTWENHTLHRTPFIYNKHLEPIKFYLRITVHSQENGNLLIYFLTDLLAFKFQRLYNVFILDSSQLSSYIQYQKELSEQQPWRPALDLHVKRGAENNRCRTLPQSKLSKNPPHSRINKISL